MPKFNKISKMIKRASDPKDKSYDEAREEALMKAEEYRDRMASPANIGKPISSGETHFDRMRTDRENLDRYLSTADQNQHDSTFYDKKKSKK